MSETELDYNCPKHGLESDCKCPESGYRDALRKQRNKAELRRLRRQVRELKKAVRPDPTPILRPGGKGE